MSNSDIAIQAASGANNNVQIRPLPSYLITLTNGQCFVALKHDKATNYIEATGFFFNGTQDVCGQKSTPEKIIKTQFTEIITKTINENPSVIVEISFPLHRIDSIQNLVYRHKGVK